MIKWGGDDLICLIRKKSNMMKYQAFEPPFNTGPSSCDSLMMKEGDYIYSGQLSCLSTTVTEHNFIFLDFY